MTSPVRAELAFPEQRLLYVVEAPGSGGDVARFEVEHRRELEELVLGGGAVLLRGFDAGVDEFAAVADAISTDQVDYAGGNTPRSMVRPGVFTSTELAAHVTIPQHHEMQIAIRWPMRVLFYCQTPAASGGQTPLCRSRRFLERLGARVVDEPGAAAWCTPRTRRESPLRSLAHLRNRRSGSSPSAVDRLRIAAE
jgi:hypothetical protein